MTFQKKGKKKGIRGQTDFLEVVHIQDEFCKFHPVEMLQGGQHAARRQPIV